MRLWCRGLGRYTSLYIHSPSSSQLHMTLSKVSGRPTKPFPTSSPLQNSLQPTTSLPCFTCCVSREGGGPRVVVSTAAFHARVRGSVPGLGGLKETKMFLPHPRVKLCVVGSFSDREVACSAPDRQGSNFESCVWRTVSSHSSHHPQEVLLAQFMCTKVA